MDGSGYVDLALSQLPDLCCYRDHGRGQPRALLSEARPHASLCSHSALLVLSETPAVNNTRACITKYGATPVRRAPSMLEY